MDRAARISVKEIVAGGIDVTQDRSARSLNQRIRLVLRITVIDFACKVLSCTEIARLKLHPKLSMKIISAALGHDVDNTTGRSPKLGIKATRLDLHFLHKLERQIVVVA